MQKLSLSENDINSFLMLGQSNMAGRGNMGDVEPIENDLCYMLRMGLWQKMSEPVNVDAPVTGEEYFSGISLAASFADELAKATGKKIGLIPCAVGGTKISEWMPGEILYDNTLMTAKIAMRTSKIKGILWHQGESDCNKDEDIALYKEKFLEIISHLKKELSLENVPMIIGELSTDITEVWNTGIRPAKLNEILRERSQELPLCRIVSSNGLTLKNDGIHFDSISCREFGKRYFKEYMKLFE